MGSTSNGAARMASSPSRAWRIGAGGGLAALFIVLDRLTKAAVLGAVVNGEFYRAVLPGVLGLRYVENTGAAFSLGEGHGYAFVALAAAVCVTVAAYLWRARAVSRLEVVGLGMVVGGAIGNAVDRLLYGFVVDFLATEFIEFPVFNVADIGITVGVALAFIGFMFLSPAARPDGGR